MKNKVIMRFFDTMFIGKKNLIGAEIGVYKGRHAKKMLDLLDIKKIYLVDAWQNYKGYENHSISNMVANAKQEAEDLLSSHKDKIVWLPFFSTEAVKHVPDGSLDFAYIDANHEYEYVKPDINLWVPKVKQGGIVGGHDYIDNRWGVKKAVDEYCKKNKIKFKVVDTNWLFVKNSSKLD